VKRNTESIDVLSTIEGMTITPCGRSLEMAERATHHPPAVHATPQGVERSYPTELYNQRTANETMNAVTKQKFGVFVRSRLWWEQLRELVITYVGHDDETTLSCRRRSVSIHDTTAGTCPMNTEHECSTPTPYISREG
jgi:hypothetical protein